MNKETNKLVDKFKEVEDKIMEELKQTKLDIDYNADRRTVISGLKAYIKRVKSIEKILDEYEAISQKLEQAMSSGEHKKDITQAVVELREDSDELKNEIQIINGQTMVKCVKKKATNVSVKEF